MIRLGCYTGKIYHMEDMVNDIEECCVILSGNEESNKHTIQLLKDRNRARCERCYGCPISKKDRELAKFRRQM